MKLLIRNVWKVPQQGKKEAQWSPHCMILTWSYSMQKVPHQQNSRKKDSSVSCSLVFPTGRDFIQKDKIWVIVIHISRIFPTYLGGWPENPKKCECILLGELAQLFRRCILNSYHLLSSYRVPGTTLGTLYKLLHLILTTPKGKYDCWCFADVPPPPPISHSPLLFNKICSSKIFHVGKF